MKHLLLLLAAASLTGAGAFAETITTGKTEASFSNRDVEIQGANVHLTSKTPLVNSKVNLKGEYAWLYLDAVKPTVAVANYLPSVSVDGVAANVETNVRVAQYGAGSVIIPHGLEVCDRALTIYTGENYQGDSRTVAIQNHNTDLGAFNNNIRSIKLRKGFMATLANNPDGTGYSRVYIASDGDLEIPVLPEGFVTKDNSGRSFVSYIRVMKWQWVSKKGWAGSDQSLMEKLNVTHYYGWDAGGPTDKIDREYAPHRHHIGWPGFDQIKSRDNVSHVLGHNEPDNNNDSKEHPASPTQIMREWTEFMRTGLRIGSPAPTGIWGNWLPGFFNLADSLNYRVDFVVYHQYEHTADFASRVNKAVSVSKGRPVWITEWNNGANWTTGNENDWPDKTGQQCDAAGNPIDGAGSVTLPATTGNQDKQLAYVKQALANIDALDALERTHFYNWVQDARALTINGELTKAGKYFADYPSKVAFTKAKEYEHKWKIAPPLPSLGFSDDYKNVRLSWYDHNGETGKCYQVYRKDDNGKYELVKTLTLGTDYQAGETVMFEDPIKCKTKSEYMVNAIAYNDTKSLYSRKNIVTRDNDVATPDVRCSATSPTRITVEWTEIEGARAYRVERRLVKSADNPNGEAEFKTRDIVTDKISFTDNDVKENSTYEYRVVVLNNSETTPVSESVAITSPSISTAPVMENLFAGAADATVTLKWDKTYQSVWNVERADSEQGPWTTVASKISANTYKDTDVKNGNTYYYRVTPIRSLLNVTGSPSRVLKATPQAGNYIYIPFDEGKFTNVRDIYSAQDGTLSAGATWTEDRNGKKSAVVLNSAKQACVTLPKGIVKGMSDFTISVWVKPGDQGGRIFDFGSGTGTFMILNHQNGVFRYKLTGGGKTVVKENIAYELEKGKWYNVALTQTGTTATLYVDGKEVVKITGALAPSVMGTTSANYLGKSQWTNDPHPDFAFDDLFIFKRGMTQDEIKEVMASTTGIETVFAVPQTLTVWVNGHDLMINSDCDRTVQAYRIDGTVAATFAVTEGVNSFDGLTPGLYIVAGNKVLIR